MSRALSPNFSLPPLSVAPSGWGLSPESLHATREELCLLVIEATLDGKILDPRLHAGSIRDWSVTAARSSAGLVILHYDETIELYSTQHDRPRACAQPLLALADWSRLHPEVGQLRVTVRRGADVAAHLLGSAAGIGKTHGRSSGNRKRIESAAELARQTGSLSPTLGTLFRAAHQVASRTDRETFEGNPRPSEALRTMAELCALRIVEEELLNWKSEQVERSRALSSGRLRALTWTQ
jgi:hypothetical protein